MDEQHFGGLLHALRRRAGLSQEDLAEAGGLSVRTIRELERGRVRTPQRRTVVMVADALQLSDPERRHFLTLSRTGRFEAVDSRTRSQNRARAVPDDPPRSDDAPADATAGRAAADGRHPTSRPTGSWPDPVRAGIPCQLPAALPDLVGRGRQMEAARQAAADSRRGGIPLALVLHGPPGIGKTSLALAVGHTLGPEFPDGQLFADLRGLSGDPAAPAEVLASFLRALGVADPAIPASLSDRQGLFRTMLGCRRMLVVLDDAAGEAQVQPLLPGTGQSLVVVTCRRPLSGLDAARRAGLDVLTETDARHLLAMLVGERRAEADPAAVDQLVQLCGRWPLALRIVGNLLASRPERGARRLVEHLRDRRRALPLLTAGALNVRASFALSYDRLEPRAARVFRCAAMIARADFDAGLAAAAAGLAEAEAAAALEELVDAGLVHSRGDRYGVHDLPRLFAADLVGDSGAEPAAAHERILGHLECQTTAVGRFRAFGAPSPRHPGPARGPHVRSPLTAPARS